METRKRTIIPSDYEKIFDIDTFLNRLDNLLRETNTSQTELATALDIKPLTITRWKNKENKIAIKYLHIQKIARFFHVDPEYLYNKEYSYKNLGNEISNKMENESEQFYSENKAFFDIFESLGYTFEYGTNFMPCVINDSGEFIPVSEKMLKRMKLAIEYTLLN